MFTFFAQTQPRLGVVALRLTTDALGEVTLVTDQDGAYLNIVGGRATIPLPGRLVRGTQVVRLVDGRGEVKIPIAREEGGVDVVQPPVGAGELNARRVRRTRCNSCHRDVWTTTFPDFDDDHLLHQDDETDISSKRRRTSSPHRRTQEQRYTFRALPSSHWYESSEAWLCHPSGEFTKKLAGVMQEGWWPAVGVGLVGERWVAVHVGKIQEERNGEQAVVSLRGWSVVDSDVASPMQWKDERLGHRARAVIGR